MTRKDLDRAFTATAESSLEARLYFLDLQAL